MSSAKSSSWPPDKGPGAETVAVPNLASVGAVNHQGLGGVPPFEDTSLLLLVDLWPEGQALFASPFHDALSFSLCRSPERPSGGDLVITR